MAVCYQHLVSVQNGIQSILGQFGINIKTLKTTQKPSKKIPIQTNKALP